MVCLESGYGSPLLWAELRLESSLRKGNVELRDFRGHPRDTVVSMVDATGTPLQPPASANPERSLPRSKAIVCEVG